MVDPFQAAQLWDPSTLPPAPGQCMPTMPGGVPPHSAIDTDVLMSLMLYHPHAVQVPPEQ